MKIPALAAALVLAGGLAPALAAPTSAPAADRPAGDVATSVWKAAHRACRLAHTASGPVDAHRACVRNTAQQARQRLQALGPAPTQVAVER